MPHSGPAINRKSAGAPDEPGDARGKAKGKSRKTENSTGFFAAAPSAVAA